MLKVSGSRNKLITYSGYHVGLCETKWLVFTPY